MPKTRIHCNAVGQGTPTLLFVHGFCCASGDWDSLIERLGSRYRCVTVDLPGHGETPGDKASMKLAGAAVNDVKQRFAQDPVILIGHSLGTKTIREAHRQDPEGVAGLILIDGSLYVTDRETMLSNARAAVANGMEPFLRGLFSRMFDEPVPQDKLDPLIARALSLDPDFARELFLDSVDWDTRFAISTLTGLDIPAMVIQATFFDSQFRWKPLAAGESTELIDRMTELVSDFEAVHIPNAGHFVMDDAADKTSTAIARFADRTLEKWRAQP